MSGEKRTLGAAIFADIEDNEYLNKIHEKVLYNYALRLLQLTKKEPLPFDQKEKRDALRLLTCCRSPMILKGQMLIKSGRRKL